MTLDDPDVTGALPTTVGSLSCRSKIVELYAQDRPILPTTLPHLPTDASSALVQFGGRRAVAGMRCGTRRMRACDVVGFAVQEYHLRADSRAARVVRQPV
jgi:hypothetical protein